MYGHLIVIEKHPDIHLVGVRETWRQFFAKCVLKATGPKVTGTCQGNKFCTWFKVRIDGVVHSVLAIWSTKQSTENLGFLLVDTKTRSTRPIILEFSGRFSVYGRPELVLFLIGVFAG